VLVVLTSDPGWLPVISSDSAHVTPAERRCASGATIRSHIRSPGSIFHWSRGWS
jgi:hypothetical protein